MTKQEFIDLLAEDGVLFDRDSWDSISIVVIVGLVNAHFDAKMTHRDLAEIDDVEGIIKFIGEDRFDG